MHRALKGSQIKKFGLRRWRMDKMAVIFKSISFKENFSILIEIS